MLAIATDCIMDTMSVFDVVCAVILSGIVLFIVWVWFYEWWTSLVRHDAQPNIKPTFDPPLYYGRPIVYPHKLSLRERETIRQLWKEECDDQAAAARSNIILADLQKIKTVQLPQHVTWSGTPFPGIDEALRVEQSTIAENNQAHLVDRQRLVAEELLALNGVPTIPENLGNLD